MRKKAMEVPKEAIGDPKKARYRVDMNKVVGQCDLLMVCLDTLRYDIAYDLQNSGDTPVLNAYGNWEKRHAPGNYTFPSHMAMFTGFFPSPAKPTPLFERERLFIAKEMGGMANLPKEAFLYEGATFIEGLSKVGYETICVGGVGFFNKRTPMNRMLPDLFDHSYWNPSFSCHIPESFENQLDFIERKLGEYNEDQRIFMYLNIDSIHYPNAFYLEGAKEDTKETHAAALQYVDRHIERLFEIFRRRSKTFAIVCSDHGSCYGEDGYHFHCLSHEIVYTVPYMQFFL